MKELYEKGGVIENIVNAAEQGANKPEGFVYKDYVNFLKSIVSVLEKSGVTGEQIAHLM